MDSSDFNALEDNSVQVQEIEDTPSISSNDDGDCMAFTRSDESGSNENNEDIAFVDTDTDSDVDDDAVLGNVESDSNDNGFESDEDDAILSAHKKTRLTESTHLELDNDADNEDIKVGDLVTWIIKVKNYGPNTAKNVKVFDKLPEGMKFINYTATIGSFDNKTGIWLIGDLESNDTQILKILTRALTLGEKVNKAILISDTNSTTPQECYEEEEIDVESDTQYAKANPKTVSSILYPTGNPIAILLISFLVLFVTGIKRRY